jgi:plasmid stability protein
VANLTITVPEDVLHRARVRAARERTSVNAVLRADLARYANDDDEVARAWQQFVRLAGQLGATSGPGGRTWTREDIQRPGSTA